MRDHPAAEPVVLVVTDGEPTAHLDPGGKAVCQYLATPRTISVASGVGRYFSYLAREFRTPGLASKPRLRRWGM